MIREVIRLIGLCVVLIALFMSFTTKVYGARLHSESWYNTNFCNELNGLKEFVLPDKTRVDCLTQTLACEVDFADKWAESVGQSYHYAQSKERTACIGLIIENIEDLRFAERLINSLRYGIRPVVIKFLYPSLYE